MVILKLVRRMCSFVLISIFLGFRLWWMMLIWCVAVSVFVSDVLMCAVCSVDS